MHLTRTELSKINLKHLNNLFFFFVPELDSYSDMLCKFMNSFVTKKFCNYRKGKKECNGNCNRNLKKYLMEGK